MKDQAKLVASFNMDNLTRKRFFFFKETLLCMYGTYHISMSIRNDASSIRVLRD